MSENSDENPKLIHLFYVCVCEFFLRHTFKCLFFFCLFNHHWQVCTMMLVGFLLFSAKHLVYNFIFMKQISMGPMYSLELI